MITKLLALTDELGNLIRYAPDETATRIDTVRARTA